MQLKQLLGAVLCLFSIHLVSAQNLIPNGSFEVHKEIRCAYCGMNDALNNDDVDKRASSDVIDGWKMRGFGGILLSQDYKPNEDEYRQGYKFYSPPADGKTIVELDFHPKTSGSKVGGGGYLELALPKPIQKGHTYKLSYQINIRNSDLLNDAPEFAKNFGVLLLDERLNFKLHNMIEKYTPFLLDTLIVDKWVKMTYTFTPTCDLNYIMAGCFDTNGGIGDIPLSDNGHIIISYFDDFRLEELKDATASSTEHLIKLDCSYSPPPKKGLDSLSAVLHFESTSDQLNPRDKAQLDSITLLMRKNPLLMFNLVGHTDNQGINNMELSIRRAENLRLYFSQQGISTYRFKTTGKGDTEALTNNATEASRALNRRVAISTQKQKFDIWLYDAATRQVLSQEIDSAFIYLKEWLKLGSTDKILCLYDPDLMVLHKDARWKTIEAAVKNAYKTYKKPSLSYTLDHLYCQDQLYRSLSNDYHNAKGYAPHQLDTLSLKYQFNLQTPNDMKCRVDLFKLLEVNEFPKQSEVGTRQASTAFLIIDHSEDINVMKHYLPIIKQRCKDKEANWVDYANLFDRIQRIEKGTQHYGTQYMKNPDKPYWYKLVPLDDEANLDEIRASIHLAPLEIYDFMMKDSNE